MVRFEWSSPQHEVTEDRLVYVLTMFDRIGGYTQQLEQTFYNNATIRRGMLKSSSVVRLAAYNSQGKVAEIEADESDFGPFLERKRSYVGQFGGGSSSNSNLVNDARSSNDERSSLDFLDVHSWTPVLVSLKHSTEYRGGVDAQLSWPRLSHSEEHHYEVEWRTTSKTSASVRKYILTDRNSAVITLIPNHEYELIVRVFSPRSRRRIDQSKPVRIDAMFHNTSTPIQHLLDDCSKCLPLKGTLMMFSSGGIFVFGVILITDAYLRRRYGK